MRREEMKVGRGGSGMKWQGGEEAGCPVEGSWIIVIIFHHYLFVVEGCCIMWNLNMPEVTSGVWRLMRESSSFVSFLVFTLERSLCHCTFSQPSPASLWRCSVVFPLVGAQSMTQCSMLEVHIHFPIYGSVLHLFNLPYVCVPCIYVLLCNWDVLVCFWYNNLRSKIAIGQFEAVKNVLKNF